MRVFPPPRHIIRCVEADGVRPRSLVGLRGYPLARGRIVKAHQTPSALLQSAAAQSRSTSPPTLYAYPAQCNATGARLGLRYAAQIKRANPNARILVDAAAYSSTSVLDLGAIPAEEAPDFVVASIYKIFVRTPIRLIGSLSECGMLMHHPRFLLRNANTSCTCFRASRLLSECYWSAERLRTC